MRANDRTQFFLPAFCEAVNSICGGGIRFISFKAGLQRKCRTVVNSILENGT